MNAAQLAQRLLVYVDQRTLSEANTAGAEYLNAACDAINSAAQELYRIVPSISIRSYGLTTRPMVTATVSMVQFDNYGTFTPTFPTYANGWMAKGGSFQGRVLGINNSLGVMLFDTMSTTAGPQSLNFYHDSVILPEGIVSVLADVILDNRALLVPASSETELNSVIRLQKTSDYGRPRPVRHQPFAPAPGIPSAYMVERSPITDTTLNSDTGATFLAMRLSPWPTGIHTISLRARVKPRKIASADLDAANNGAACTATIELPSGWDETYLLPIALQHFTMSPFWNNQGAREEIRRRYEWTLQTLTLANPQRDRPIDIYPAI